MFKRVGNTLVVGNSSVPLLDGSHDIFLDKNTLAVSLDVENPPDNLKKIATYDFNEEKNELTITKNTFDFENKKPKLYLFARSMTNNIRVHNNALYNEGSDFPVSGYIEGIPIDFNYTSFFMSTMAMATYPWIGGRSCFKTLLFGSINSNPPRYTAKPMTYCAEFDPKFWIILQFSVSAVGLVLNPVSYELSLDSQNLAFNRWSLMFSFYNFRRYSEIVINKENMFSINFENNDVQDFSPVTELSSGSSYSIPNFNTKFSMFNLTQ